MHSTLNTNKQALMLIKGHLNRKKWCISKH